MFKYRVALFILFFTSPAFAYLKVGVLNIQTPKQLITKAEKEGFEFPKTEINQKKEIEVKRSKDPADFKEQVLEGELSNSPDYQSFIYEIYVGKSAVEKAKLLAKYQMYKVIKEQWSQIKNTTLNENDEESFSNFDLLLKKRLDAASFAPIKKGKEIKTDDFRFRFEEWGFAIVSKDLKKVTWKLSLGSIHDGNKLQPGAEDIRIEGRGSKFKSTPVPDENL